MQALKKNPYFFATLIIIGLLIIAQTVFAIILSNKENELSKILDKKLQNRDYLQKIIPSPDNQNLLAANSNYKNIVKQLEEYRSDITINAIKQTTADNNITNPEDLYFDLVDFIEAKKNEAKINNIKLVNGDAENFGFNKFIESGTGPNKEKIEGVYKQRLILDYILKNLYLSKPKSIVSIAREEVNSSAENSILSEKKSGSDIFQINQRISDNVPGVVDTTAFKLTFTSRTQSLRSFLKLLSNFEYPLVVQSVEVEPFKDIEKNSALSNANNLASLIGQTLRQDPNSEQQIPVVSNNISKFTVTIEYIELK